MSFRGQTSDADAAARNLVRDGVVLSVVPGVGAVVDLGDGLVIGPIPWLAARAGKLKIWTPPSQGEQVQVVAPEGDYERARITGSLFCDAFSAPASEASTRLEWEDGTWIGYDAGQLDIHVVSLLRVESGRVEIVATEITSITGDVRIEGDVEILGEVTVTEDVVADGVSLKDHVHSGVTAGAADTGKPKP